MLRGIGPSLPLEGALPDPQLQVFDSTGAEIAFNNNWREATNRQEISASSIAPNHDLESAVLHDLAPGAYTAVLRGVGGATGIGLVEVYDMSADLKARVANISTRGLVQTGDDVMIGGFIVTGDTAQRVIVRAIGPSLAVPGRLEDPRVELWDGNGTLLQANDNWRTDQEEEIIATTIAPQHDDESAIVRTLTPAPYTAVVRGVGNTTGVALVEVYALP